MSAKGHGKSRNSARKNLPQASQPQTTQPQAVQQQIVTNHNIVQIGSTEQPPQNSAGTQPQQQATQPQAMQPQTTQPQAVQQQIVTNHNIVQIGANQDIPLPLEQYNEMYREPQHYQKELEQVWDHDKKNEELDQLFGDPIWNDIFERAPANLNDIPQELEVVDDASAEILRYFNKEEIGSSYNTVVTGELEKHLDEASSGTRQFSDLEHSVAQIKDYDPNTGLFRVQWKDSLEYSSSLATLDWCFLYASLRANHIPYSNIQKAYEDWKKARQASDIERYRGFNFPYPKKYIAGFFESVRRLKHVNPRVIPQNAIQTFRMYKDSYNDKVAQILRINPSQRLTRDQKRSKRLCSTFNQIVKIMEDFHAQQEQEQA